MPLEYIDKLNIASIQLNLTKTLLCYINDYFKHENPNVCELAQGYSSCGDLALILSDIIMQQTKVLEELCDEAEIIFRGAKHNVPDTKR